MEVRATFGGAKGSRALVSGLLVALAVAVGAAGGYVAANVGGSKAVLTQRSAVTAAQTNAQRELLPGYVQREIAGAAPAPRLSQDSPEFIAKYGQYSWVPGSEYAIPQDSGGLIQKSGEDSWVPGSEYAIP